MVEKLRKNYSLSLWLTRLFFYISFVFCNWFDIESAFNLSLIHISEPTRPY